MKVLQVSKFYPPHLGGIETVARDLSVGLRAQGVEVDVLCANKRWEQVVERDAVGCQVTRAASAGLLLSTSAAPGLLPRLRERRDDYDVFHVHMPDPLAALAVWWARPRGRVVLHWHSDVVRQRLAMHLYEPLQRWLLARADAVIATSELYARSSLPLQPHLHKVVVVPIGRPAPTAAKAQRVAEVQQRYAGRRLIFSLGRMTYYKGYEVLIEAARQLPEDVVVVVAGGGPDLPHYQALARARGVDERVRFVGPMSAERVDAHFALARMFCMASTLRAEAYGVAVLEAMSHGVPVVASAIPGSGLTWLHRDGVTGLAVPPGDAPALARALQRLLDDDALRQHCAEGARQRWADGLNAEAMCAQVLALYRALPGGTIPALSDDPSNRKSD
jgi:rhamnosyl/mannosyltransferase